MDKLRQPGSAHIPYVAGIALLLLTGLLFANPQTVVVQVTFVNPVGISEANTLQFGTLNQNLADQESVTVAPDGTVSDPAERVEGGTQAAASLTVTTSPGQAITIHAHEVDSGAGYSLADFRCNYNAGSDAICDGTGYSETSVASGGLLVGATLTGDGTAVADGALEVTITYQ